MTPADRFRAVLDRIRHRLDPDELLEMEKVEQTLRVEQALRDEPERA